MAAITTTEEVISERYVVDYTSDRFHFPVPGQICFHVCYPNQTYPTIRKRNVILVKCMGESAVVKTKVGTVIKIEVQQLNEDTGDAATDANGRQKSPFDVNIPIQPGSEEPLHRPGFIRATKSPSITAQNHFHLMHEVAVTNAKLDNLQQQMAALAQPSSIQTTSQPVAVWAAQPQQMQEYYAMPAEPYTMRVPPNAFRQ